MARGGDPWGIELKGTFTEDERQQLLNVAISVDDQGNSHMYFNRTIKDTKVQPSEVAGNLNLDSDMFMGNSPFVGYGAVYR